MANDFLTIPESHPATATFQLHRGEPFLAIPQVSGLILTPARSNDIPERSRMMQSPSVDPWVFSPPKPYTEEAAAIRFAEQSKTEREIFERWDEGVLGLPTGTMRLRQEGREDRFVGEVGIKREDDYTEIEDEAERNKAIEENLQRPPGDPKIRWTLYCELPQSSALNCADLRPVLLNAEHAGQGFTSRVMQYLFATYFLDTLNVHHIISYAFTGNAGSRAIHLKLGFVEKEIDWVRMPEHRGGQMREEWVFEWKRT